MSYIQKTKITQIDALVPALSYQKGEIEDAVVSIEDTQTNTFRFYTETAINETPSLEVAGFSAAVIKSWDKTPLRKLLPGLHEVIKVGTDYIIKQTAPLEVYYQRVELVEDTNTITLPEYYNQFIDTFDVYVGGIFQSPNSYTLNAAEKRITTANPGTWLKGYIFDIKFHRVSKTI